LICSNLPDFNIPKSNIFSERMIPPSLGLLAYISKICAIVISL
jgi:hypothetical protein